MTEPVRSSSLQQSQVNAWLQRFRQKANCIKGVGHGVIYLYHARKTAGSSLGNALKQIAGRSGVKYLDTEGIVVDECAFSQNVLSAIAIRNPIDRIFSLYWYEHVDFFYSIKKEPDRAKSFEVWMNAWLDGSQWKNKIKREYPYENYVEIENYYVKSLISWKGSENRRINYDDFVRACQVLESKFEIVFITEWLHYGNQSGFLDEIFPLGYSFLSKDVVGKIDLKKKLKGKMIGQNENVYISHLREVNKYDIMLWEYAMSLVEMRAIALNDNPIFSSSSIEANICKRRSSINSRICRNPSKTFGLFQTPGHKGPF